MALIYFKQNKRMNWCDVISNKIRPKRSSFGVRNSLPKQTFQKCLFRLVNTFKLPLVRGDYITSFYMSKNMNTLETSFVVLVVILINQFNTVKQ